MNNEEITSFQMSIFDINAEWFGVPRYLLMENAGSGLAHEINSRLSEIKLDVPCSIAIFCGSGGNGGDGFVLARHLYNKHNVLVYLLGYPERISSKPAKSNWNTLQNLPNLKKAIIRDSQDILTLPWQHYDIIIDAILGSGLEYPPRNPHAFLIQKINETRSQETKVWSIDVPSGLLKDGKMAPISIKPDVIFSLHKPKLGTTKVANTITVPIGIPYDAMRCSGPGYFLPYTDNKSDSHKGENGKVLIIGGSKLYHGAPILSGLATLATQVDLVYFFTSEFNSQAIKTTSPEFILHTFPEPYFNDQSVPQLMNLAKDVDTILLGPGMSISSEIEEGILNFINDWLLLKPRPNLVIDADGLKQIRSFLDKLPENVILTPHAGEFKYLTGKKLPSISDLSERIEMVQKISDLYPFTWIIKGKVDLIASKGKLIENYTGCSAMTIGGTGDILAGVTSGLYTKFRDPFISAVASTFLTGLVGEIYHQKFGNLSSRKMIEFIPNCLKEIKKFISEEDNIFSNRSFVLETD